MDFAQPGERAGGRNRQLVELQRGQLGGDQVRRAPLAALTDAPIWCRHEQSDKEEIFSSLSLFHYLPYSRFV
jgi:hypothetical protein